MSTKILPVGQLDPTPASVSGGDNRVNSVAEKLADRLNRDAKEIAARLGFMPTSQEVSALADDLATIGALPPERAEAAKAFIAQYQHAEGAAVAYDRLIDEARPSLADRAIEWLATIFRPDDKIELVAISPTGGIEQVAGRLDNPTERAAMLRFVQRRPGRSNLYFGVQPRRQTYGGTHRGRDGDIAEHRHLLVDVDRAESEDDAAWEARSSVVIDRFRALGASAIWRTGSGGLQAMLAVEATADPAEMKRRVPILNAALKASASDPVADLVRIGRLPPTINVPTPKKRARGRTVALARPIDLSGTARVWQVHDLCAALHGDTAPGEARGTFGAAARPAAPAAAPSSNDAPLPRRGVPAPSADLLRRAGKALPNDGAFDLRHDYVSVLHPIRGSAGDDLALAVEVGEEWDGRWHLGGDPDEARRIIETIGEPATGWPELLAILAEHNPEAYRAIQRECTMAAFNAAPIDPATIPQPEVVDTKPRAHDAARAALRVAGLSLFRTPEGKLFGSLGYENFNIASPTGKRAIAGALIKLGVRISKNARAELMDELEAEASISPVRPIHVRTAFEEATNTLWIDLGDGTGRAVIVAGNAGTWRVDVIPPDGPRFHRPNGSAPVPVPIPKSGGTLLGHIRALLNLPAIARQHDPNDAGVQAEAAILLAIVSWVLRIGTAALMFIGGPQGAGKTSAARLLTAILDPTAGDVARPPADARDLFVVARSRLAIVIDNLSDLDGDFADALAALLSGADLPRRALYSDDDVVSLRARAGIIITSVVTDIIHRADLGDRMVRLELAPVTTRRTEAELRAEFATRHPAMLGALLDALAAGLRDRVVITNAWGGKRLIRLLDAAVIAEGAARSMGWPPNLLIEAIDRSRSSAVDDLLAADPVAHGVEQLLNEQPVPAWSGTARELMSALGFAMGRRDGPKTERGLTAALDRLREPLRERGIVFDRLRDKGRDRTRRLVLRREGGAP
jgi:hypothetical protein